MPRILLLLLALVVGVHAAADTDPLAMRAGDLVRVRVHDNTDLDLDVRVPAAGGVAVALIGEVVFTGRTPEQVATEIRRKLEDGFLKSANVAVSVVEAPRTAYILGAVRTPGSVALGGTPMTALQAVAASGGFTDDADRASARVLRPDAARPGEVQSIPLPTADTPEAIARDPRLQPGDTVVVGRRDRIYVHGQVLRPGALEVPAQGAFTVSRAIAQAGGFDRFARQDAVMLIRPGAESRRIDVEKIFAGKAEDPVLMPGDSLMVPESSF